MECKDISDLPQGNQSLSPERNSNPSHKRYPRRKRGGNVRQTGNDRVSQREQTKFRVPEGAASERGHAGRRGGHQRSQQGCFSNVQFAEEVGAKVGPINVFKEECLDNAALVDDVTDSMTDLTLRDRLIAKLRSGLYSCLICLCYVEPRDPTWSCDGCFRVFHLSCMTDWALSSKLRKNDEPTSPGTKEPRNSWRCPACQKSHSAATRPLVYYCFCGKTSRPDYHPGYTTIPHGCDEVCGKPKAKQIVGEISRTKRSPPCPHTCTELCHPGPCPPCTAVVQLHCPCGRVVKSARCGDEQPKPCGAPCGRTYAEDLCAFGTHTCPLRCHDGDCPPCSKLIKSVCYCGRVDEVTRCGSERAKRYDLSAARGDPVVGELDPCDIEMFFHDNEKDRMELLQSEKSLVALYVGTVFSCEQVCDRPLACGHHKCSMPCHPGECRPCPLSPSLCLTCPCGRVPLNKLVADGDAYGNRKVCTDPIPLCPNICGRPNPICGHPCPEKCHPGPSCPPCKLTAQITCRCGKSSKVISCSESAQSALNKPSSAEFLCERICRKKKSCGRHKCNRKCCDMVIHACNEICGRMLSCGKHTCEDVCHCGPCGTCWRGVIYEELYCYCGATCLPPPQPCGSLPPECPEPCSREHPCDHPVQHTCHSEPECPKCTVLMTKRCLGDHTWMFNVPCFQTVVTCGRPCDKPLPRCSHRCKRQCHPGPCLADASSEASGCTPPESACTQPCTAPRSGCGHPCGQPCHEASGITCSQALGKLKCQFMIPLVCACGHRQEEQPCYQVSILVAALKKKDPNFFLRSQNSQSSKLPFGLPSNDVLPCDSSCTRANQEAEAKATAPTMWVRGGAHVVDDSLPAPFPPPEYSDWLKQFALDNLSFAADVEKTLYELVEKAFESTKAGNKADFNKCISHRFDPMNRHKRRFIIELAEFYGIECVELDPGPHRHVQALTTAAKARFPGGGSKQHFVSLVGKMQSNFVGPVKFPEPAQPQIMKPAFLRSVQDDSSKNVSFSSVVGNKGLTDKSTWDD